MTREAAERIDCIHIAAGGQRGDDEHTPRAITILREEWGPQKSRIAMRKHTRTSRPQSYRKQQQGFHLSALAL
jgi:hypothetical protein